MLDSVRHNGNRTNAKRMRCDTIRAMNFNMMKIDVVVPLIRIRFKLSFLIEIISFTWELFSFVYDDRKS